MSLLSRALAAALAALATAAASGPAAHADARIEVVPADGTPRTVLVQAGGEHTQLTQLGWAADGSSITYVRESLYGGPAAALFRRPLGGGPAQRLRTIGGAGQGLASPDARLVAEEAYVTSTRRVRPIVIREVATGAVRARIRPLGRPHDSSIVIGDGGPFCWSPDGRLLTVSESLDEGDVDVTRVFVARTGRLVRTIRGDGRLAREACFAPDGRLTLSSGLDVPTAARLVELGTGRATAVPTHGRPVHGPLAWSPDGARLAYGSAEGVAVVDTATGHGPTLPVTPTGLRDRDAAYGLRALAWSPDGRTLAYAYGGSGLLDADEGPRAILATMPADGSGPPRELVRASAGTEITGLAWSPDGTRLALASAGR